jgi:RNA polymerase sigma factor (sigma-70 family)
VYQIPIDRDGVALALLAAGDRRGAAAEIVRIHGGRVREYLRALLRDADASDDAFSLFLEWILGAVGAYRGEASLATFTLGVAYNAARAVRRDGYRRRRRTLRSAQIARLAAGSGRSSAERHERAARRLDALRRHLSEQDRNLLALRLEQRLEWEEIANVLASAGEAVSAEALRQRFHRLKRRIGELAQEMGVLE